MRILFWVSLFIIFYTYVGYGIVLFLLIKIKRLFVKKEINPYIQFTPSLTLVVAAYNEEKIIEEKIKNTLELEYPRDKLKIIFITDGSEDRTQEIINKYGEIMLLHENKRAGKIAAVHRAMEFVDSEIVVFTDANTFIHKDSLLKLSRHYIDPLIGAVSGEKRVQIDESADATAGEGFYWKYESKLKKWDAELYSVVGAAGELFSIRKSLYIPVEADTLLDDFMISMKIAINGYKIAYDPDAYAMETSSENLKEELKRKVRIAAGGIQSVFRTSKLFNPFFNPILSFQYISHRVLRWTITPILMILVFFINIYLITEPDSQFYLIILLLQVAFYGSALLGWGLESKEIRIKVLFIPYYFVFMNYAMILGMFKYANSSQSVLWDKAKRK